MRSLIREKVFRKHYAKLLQSRSGKKVSPSVNAIESVTILTSSKIYPIHALKNASKYFTDISIVCHPYFLVYKTDDLDFLEEVHVIHAENGKFGVPNQELLVKWLANKSDLLIVLNQNNELLIKYLCAASNSKLKASLKTKNTSTEDLDVDLWLDTKLQPDAPLVEQCAKIYEMISLLGARPPLIER